MSEFSDSYHLRNGSVDAAAELIRRAGQTGYVLEPIGPWVTFVCAQSEMEPLDSVIDANLGTLVYYLYAEDHSWGFQIYEADDVTCTYFCDWSSGEIVVNDSDLDMSVVEKLMKPDSEVSLKDLDRLFHPESIYEVFDNGGAANGFAQAVGLTHYNWLSYHYVELMIERNEQRGDWGTVTPVD